MSVNISNLGECSMDSCSLRFEIPSLDYHDKRLNENLITLDAETLSVVESEFKRKSKRYYHKGFSVYASISENVRVNRDEFSDCLILLVNSKQLGSRYFEGLTIYTMPIIFELVKELEIFSCSYNTFLNCSITDIDFKKDNLIEFPDYKELISGCSTMTKPSNDRDKGRTIFSRKDNYGISWSVRKTSKYLSSPYTKVYHKGLEFSKPTSEGGSKDFKDMYLSSVDTSNIMRLETTVKNKKHLQSLKIGLKTFTLRDILNLTTDQKDKIISKAVNSHLLPRTRSLAFKLEKDMSPTNRIYLNLLLGLISDGNFTFQRALNLALNGIKNDSSKSNNKKTLTRLYNDHLRGTDYDKKSSKIESVFDSFGWF